MANLRCLLLKTGWHFREDKARSIILTGIPAVAWALLLGLVELIANSSGKPTDQWLQEHGFPSVIMFILVGSGIMVLLMIAIVALMVLPRNPDLEAVRPYFDALSSEQKDLLRRILPLGSVSGNVISSAERDDLEYVYQTCRFVFSQDAHYIVNKDYVSRLSLLLKQDEIKQRHWHETPENELTGVTHTGRDTRVLSVGVPVSLSDSQPQPLGQVIDRRSRRLSEDQKRQLVQLLKQDYPPRVYLRYRNFDMEACQFVQDFRDVFNEAGWTRIISDYLAADSDTRRGLFVETKWNHIPPTGAHTLANALKDVGLTVTLQTSRSVRDEDDVVFMVGGIED